jgi:putative transcriptional regulator
MEKEYFDELMTSLEDAAAFAAGDETRARAVEIEMEDSVPEYKAADVARARKDLKLSQRALADVMGVSTRTVEAWEAGKNTPSGAARHLLYLLDSDHTLVRRLVTK